MANPNDHYSVPSFLPVSDDVLTRTEGQHKISVIDEVFYWHGGFRVFLQDIYTFNDAFGGTLCRAGVSDLIRFLRRATSIDASGNQAISLGIFFPGRFPKISANGSLLHYSPLLQFLGIPPNAPLSANFHAAYPLPLWPLVGGMTLSAMCPLRSPPSSLGNKARKPCYREASYDPALQSFVIIRLTY
jgi:hypothetical protein